MKSKSKYCKKCKRLLTKSSFYKSKKNNDGLTKYCVECLKQYSFSYSSSRFRDYRERMLYSSSVTAKLRNIEHTITLKDIPSLPKYCPYLSIELNYEMVIGKKRTNNTPSIDRIDSSKGYIPGNIQIISWLANRMKTNATIEQLIEFAKGILRTHSNYEFEE